MRVAWAGWLGVVGVRQALFCLLQVYYLGGECAGPCQVEPHACVHMHPWM